jgi:undecaprenyl diphosphate synthase
MSFEESNIPKHVAIIMDGNRRWAKARSLPVVMGHKKVAQERVEELIEYAGELNIPYITFWAFSTENWKRDADEVKGHMDVFRWALKNKAEEIVKKGARVRYIGDLAKFPADIQKDFQELMERSAENNKITATFALNYGGRDELLRAIKNLFEENSKIDEEAVSRSLDTVGIPDVDLIIRTSGEQRLSGFMPWQSVYSELYFTKVLMPDFDKKEMEKALEEYGKRKRRFGE